MDNKPLISFCIVTSGKDIPKLQISINSIIRSCFKSGISYEIIVVGSDILSIAPRNNLKIINETEKNHFIGYKRNIAFRASSSNNIVFCDDDIIFPENWAANFTYYDSCNQSWLIVGNRILCPNGGRYWDRAIYFPRHMMVDYDYNENSEKGLLYQCGCFLVVKRSLIDKISWRDDIPFYGERKGFRYNEDVEFSDRLNKYDIKLNFDQNNLVWHFDRSYKCDKYRCIKMSDQEIPAVDDLPEFTQLIEKCQDI